MAQSIGIQIYLSLIEAGNKVPRLGIRTMQPLPAANVTGPVMAWEGRIH